MHNEKPGTFSQQREEEVLAVSIDWNKCNGCGACIASCSRDALGFVENRAIVYPALCRECGFCVPKCKNGAMKIYGKPIGTYPREKT
ncbi:MAG: hypothetical protein GF350_07690 [Chitinivibrionales bacterium]|nr:hypothetical protein [Chitinivibrionales bacterium]